MYVVRMLCIHSYLFVNTLTDAENTTNIIVIQSIPFMPVIKEGFRKICIIIPLRERNIKHKRVLRYQQIHCILKYAYVYLFNLILRHIIIVYAWWYCTLLSGIAQTWQLLTRTTLWCWEFPVIVYMQLLVILIYTRLYSWVLYYHSKICYKSSCIYKYFNIYLIILTLDRINENVCAVASSKHRMKRKVRGGNAIFCIY